MQAVLLFQKLKFSNAVIKGRKVKLCTKNHFWLSEIPFTVLNGFRMILQPVFLNGGINMWNLDQQNT